MTIENAELAKIAITVCDPEDILCEYAWSNLRDMPADIDAASDALGHKRIGRTYLTGGFGFGGPCFPLTMLPLHMSGVPDVDCQVPLANQD